MLPLNSSACPLFTFHGYLVREADTFDANKTLEHISAELGSPGSTLAAGIAFVVLGLIGLLFGARLVRPTLFVLCAFVGGFVAQAALFNIHVILSATPCLVGGLATALAALAAALLGLFVLNIAFFCAGAAVGVGLVVTFFRLFPWLDISLLGGPVVDGHGLLPYWAAAFVLALTLGLLLMRKKEQQVILILLTAFVSACVLVTGAEIIDAAQGGPVVPPEASAAVALVLFLLGATFQAWRHKKKKRVVTPAVAYLDYSHNERSQRLLRP